MHHRFASLGRTWVLCGCAVACVVAQTAPLPAADLRELLADQPQPPKNEHDAAPLQPASTATHYRLTLVRSTDKQTASRGHGGTVYSVAVTPDGKRVLIGGDSRTPLAMLWNIETGDMERYFDFFDMAQDGSPFAVAIGPDGKK